MKLAIGSLTSRRRRKRSGFLLMLVLSILFCCLVLLLGLTIWSSDSVMLSHKARSAWARQQMAQELARQLELQLSQNPAQAPTVSDIEITTPNASAELDWKKDSVYQAPPTAWAGGLFTDWAKQPPSVGYPSDGKDGTPLGAAPWNVQAVAEFSVGSDYQIVARSAFPHGAFAPWGGVTVAGAVQGFANPSFTQTFDAISGIPVSLAAGEDIEVDGNFPAGTASSAQGNVSLPDGSGAWPKRGLPLADPYTDAFHNAVAQAIATISAGTLDKTNFVVGDPLDPLFFWSLITGQTPLTSIFSLEQACAIPMPLIPMLQNEDDFDVISLHVPYPPDFSGAAETLEALATALALDIAGDAVIPFFSNAMGALGPYLAILVLANNSSVIPGPAVTYIDEHTGSTVGWSYLEILKRMDQILADFFTAVFVENGTAWNTVLEDLLNVTRVVHFVDRNPIGGFTENGGFTLAMTWTVPPGRTLHLGKGSDVDYMMVGDLWIQKGATMVVDGNLFLVPPDQDDFPYLPLCAVKPTGTLYLEQGASLIVRGNLLCQGSPELGSVSVATPVGQSPPISTAILCTGDVQLPCGTASSATIEDILLSMKAAGGETDFEAIATDIVHPLLVDVAPPFSRLIGPFAERSCWFADWATTFVLIPELVEFGLQGPWPIPMPYKNCWKTLFGYITMAYSAELNFTLGENLYTHAYWWPFGQGVVPVLPKVSATVYADVFNQTLAGFEATELNPQAILSTVEAQARVIMPRLAKVIFDDIVSEIVTNIVTELFDGEKDPCSMSGDAAGDGDTGGSETGGSESSGSEATGEEAATGGASPSSEGGASPPSGTTDESVKGQAEAKEEGDKFVDDELDKVQDAFVDLMVKVLAVYRSEIEAGAQTALESQQGGAAREMSGVLVYSGGQLQVGSDTPATKASGLFFAEGDALIGAQSTFGIVVSRTGSINIGGDFYYYPYFSRAFLWNPQKPSTYDSGAPVPGFLQPPDLIQDSLMMTTPTAGKGVDLGLGGVSIISEGPR